MRIILLIGAGQLGSRHLQALALCEDSLRIIVVDPNNKNLEISKHRFEDISGSEKHLPVYIPNISAFEENDIDLAIIATNSNVRSIVINELYSKCSVRFLILEKVLFQSIDEYEKVSTLFKEAQTTVYVNHSRRMFQFYQKIKNQLEDSANIQMEVIGNDWGLGCNSVHFIDLFSFITGEFIESWDSNLSPVIMNSKRVGFKEFHGNISGKTLNGNSLSITSFEGGIPNVSIRISTEKYRYVIEEWDGVAHFVDVSAVPAQRSFPLNLIPQSKLTNIILDQLAMQGDCLLTTFEDSCRVHTPFISIILNHYNFYSKGSTSICPIT